MLVPLPAVRAQHHDRVAALSDDLRDTFNPLAWGVSAGQRTHFSNLPYGPHRIIGADLKLVRNAALAAERGP